jgi:hypothetical protein
LQKKKQKNSYFLGVVAHAGQTPTVIKSFLLLFFKKEALACVFKKIRAFAGMTAWSFGGR